MPTMSPPSVASTRSAPPTSSLTRFPSTGSAPSGRLLPWIRQSRVPVGLGALIGATLKSSAAGGEGYLGPDVDHVAVLNDVVAALDPQGATVAGGGVAAGVDQLVPGDHLGADEALLDVAVNPARGLVCGSASRQGPGQRLLVGVGCEEADQIEQLESGSDQSLESGALDAELPAHLLRLIGLQIPQIRFDARRDHHHLRRHAFGVGDQVRGCLALTLVDVDDIEDGLRRERGELPQGVRCRLRNRYLTRRAAGRQRLDHPLEPVTLRDRLLPAGAGLLGDSLEAALG